MKIIYRKTKKLESRNRITLPKEATDLLGNEITITVYENKVILTKGGGVKNVHVNY